MNRQLDITDFLDHDYAGASLYMSYRSIANVVDGLKPSQRKVIYTVRKKNLTTETKVSSLASLVALQTQYLHGEASMQGVIENMAQSYTGSNNIPLLSPEGNFGTRLLPEPSAPRYIYTKMSKNLDLLFRREDDPILIGQIFEGDEIEPRYYVPVLPMLLVNGARGMGVGYAQNILPRNPETLRKSIRLLLEGRKPLPLVPWYRGFTGTIQQADRPGVWEICGTIERMTKTRLKIVELPIGYSLQQYLKVLRGLQESKTIRSYRDLSDPREDRFLFTVDVPREFLEHDDRWILEQLGLVLRETENLTCFDENNMIHSFSSPEEILEYYVKIRLQYYTIRKRKQIETLSLEIDRLKNTIRFIREVNEGVLVLSNKTRLDLEGELKSRGYARYSDRYDYLTTMPVLNLTQEKLESLISKKEELELEKKKLEEKTERELWLDEIG